LALTGTTEQSQAGQSLNPEKENNSQLGALNSQLIENNSQLTEKVAVQINTERLKFIDELSRLILELKKQFPEIAQHLSKARDNVSANTENIPVKDLINLLKTVQQNLNVLANTTTANIEKPEIAEKIKNLVGEIIKILQPSSENPPEQKLIQALSKNDFASANIAIKTIVEAVIAQAPQITQAPQVTQVPTPVPLQPLPQQQQIPQVSTPLPQQQQIQQVPQAVPITQTPQTPQAAANIQQTFQIIFNALQELKVLGLPKELEHAPLKELETIALQKTGIEIPKDLEKNLPVVFGEKPIFATINVTPTMIRVTPLMLPIPFMPEMQKIPEAEMPKKTETQQVQQTPQVQQTQPVVPQTPHTTHIPNTSYIPHTAFEIPLPKNFPIKIPVNQKIEIAISLYQIPEQIPNQKNETANITNTANKTTLVLHPWVASVQIPKEERNFWQKTDLPLTPQTLNIRETVLSFGKLPENPEPVKLFASGMHELSLQTEQGANIPKEQVNLLWRIVQNPQILQTLVQTQVQTPTQAPTQAPTQMPTQMPMQTPTQAPTQMPTQAPTQAPTQMQSLPPQITQTLLKYQPLGNYEGDLFKNLPEPVKRELLQELPAGKTWQPETLQKAVEKILEKYTEQQPQAQTLNEHTSKMHEEIKSTLQNLKEQIQWTRLDQDTRLQPDKENVFYFMHANELQKGRLKVKDERKGGSKHRQDSSISFSIETKAKNLGNVHADLTLSKNILGIRLQDEVGTAGDAVKEERETLAKELADIGITLGELIYGKTPKIQNLPIAKKEGKSNGGLDVRA